MMAIGRLKQLAPQAIGRHRRSRAVKVLHGLTSFVESAYSNEGSNLAVNGERVLLQKLKPANFRLALDVGANVGDWLTEALAVWPDCYVHAFEVAPQTFRHLSDRIGGSERDQIALRPAGVSDRAGVERMHYFRIIPN